MFLGNRLSYWFHFLANQRQSQPLKEKKLKPTKEKSQSISQTKDWRVIRCQILIKLIHIYPEFNVFQMQRFHHFVGRCCYVLPDFCFKTSIFFSWPRRKRIASCLSWFPYTLPHTRWIIMTLDITGFALSQLITTKLCGAFLHYYIFLSSLFLL
jgi:hypothetical protein